MQSRIQGPIMVIKTGGGRRRGRRCRGGNKKKTASRKEKWLVTFDRGTNWFSFSLYRKLERERERLPKTLAGCDVRFHLVIMRSGTLST